MQLWLIDSDSQMASHLANLLPADHELAPVTDSRDAVEKLQNGSNPDAILLDLWLPPYLTDSESEEGLALLEKLKNELAPDTPVLVLSNLPPEVYGPACLWRGAEAYIEKPYSIRALMDQLAGFAA